ncbi:MAG: DNA repair protein RecN [Gemmatimonadaceae bacterium]|nr:DNA repair protein RecN [Chitinophagaceae bacterium]
MLQKLHIQNYAIIDHLEIAFPEKLNIITGETGAGKSILMGALSLILGERADSSALQNRAKKCIVEGFFAAEGRKEIKHFLRENDLDTDDELVIRREIAASGKSRAFINDSPVNLEQLRTLSAMLVDLHQQFDTLTLGESDFQRAVIDALAGHGDSLTQYRTVFKQLQHTSSELKELQTQKNTFTKEYDYNKFLFDELEEISLKENEIEQLEAELKMLSNSEGIKSMLLTANTTLSEGETPISQQLKSLCNQISQYTSFHTELPALLARLQSAQIEVTDIAGELDHINGSVNHDPARIEEINQRTSSAYKLMKKHGANSTTDLLAIKDALDSKLQAVLNIDEAIANKEKVVLQLRQDAESLAATISSKRNSQAAPFEEKVNKLLSQVGMPNAKIRVDIQPSAQLNETGADKIEFLFDANKSNRFEPIRKVASGGELSRLMLCIKSLVAQSLDMPTLIFDEIDSGISGEAAKQVGIIMKGLAKKRQVLCITHQPQIAGKADAHFFVYKEIQGDAIKTNIRVLTKDERITAIAQMLSGEKPTAAALENAREMVMN